VLVNVVALAIAWWQRWPMLLLMTTYWVQSVVIGWYSGRRMLELRRFFANGVRYDEDEPPDEHVRRLIAAGLPTPERFAKRNTVKFFAMHYGLFHFIYLFIMLIVIQTGEKPGGMAVPEIMQRDLLWIAAISLAFVLTHRASFFRNLEHDRQGRPNIGTLMFLPYARVIPMHLTFIFGLTMGYTGAVLFFGALKTFADVLMHWVEHRVLGASVRPKPEL
jgi:hypothetical protein